MAKRKTHKGLAKRIKVTARGKLKHRRPGKSHLLSVKNAKRRRRLRTTDVVRKGKSRIMKAKMCVG
jgi:large subunit ribosomal protein L35